MPISNQKTACRYKICSDQEQVSVMVIADRCPLILYPFSVKWKKKMIVRICKKKKKIIILYDITNISAATCICKNRPNCYKNAF